MIWARRVFVVLVVVAALATPATLIGSALSSGASKSNELAAQAAELRAQAAKLCTFQHRSWDIQHLQILDDAKPSKPSEAILRAFPQFRSFYDPKNPLYAEQIRSLNERRDRKLKILGPRPICR